MFLSNNTTFFSVTKVLFKKKKFAVGYKYEYMTKWKYKLSFTSLANIYYIVALSCMAFTDLFEEEEIFKLKLNIVLNKQFL